MFVTYDLHLPTHCDNCKFTLMVNTCLFTFDFVHFSLLRAGQVSHRTILRVDACYKGVILGVLLYCIVFESY